VGELCDGAGHNYRMCVGKRSLARSIARHELVTLIAGIF